MRRADRWKDYELLDAGNGEKLERWGDVVLRRPDRAGGNFLGGWQRHFPVLGPAAGGGLIEQDGVGDCAGRRRRVPRGRLPQDLLPLDRGGSRASGGETEQRQQGAEQRLGGVGHGK